MRREQLLSDATEHVLRHGLIGLSLRPLAKAIGTSDRMLIYHFGSRDQLVGEIMRRSNDRNIAAIQALPPSPSPRRAVLDLWAECTTEEQARCQRLYVEASALGLLGAEPYHSEIQAANQRWLAALADHLATSGLPRGRARRAAVLVDATFMGLQLDDPVSGDVEETARAVRDLATAVGD